MADRNDAGQIVSRFTHEIVSMKQLKMIVWTWIVFRRKCHFQINLERCSLTLTLPFFPIFLTSNTASNKSSQPLTGTTVTTYVIGFKVVFFGVYVRSVYL